MNLNLPAGKLIDISLPLDARTFHMRTYSGFKKDMQFEVEVIKDYEDGGYGQIVRGAHMRLHAGTHVDAPSHMLKGAPDLQEVPLRAYFGDAIIADIRHRGGIADVGLHERQPLVVEQAFEIGQISGVGELVDGNELRLLAALQEHADEVRPDESSRASYENRSHG